MVFHGFPLPHVSELERRLPVPNPPPHLQSLTFVPSGHIDLPELVPSLALGRVAMLATMGYIVPEYFRFPGLCRLPTI